MIPETFTFIADMTSRARALGMEVLVEVHGHYQDQVDVARHVDWVYDFVLPPLVLHTLYTRDATRLMHWIDVRPRNAVTVLDTHDGIGVQDAGADRRRQTILLGLTLFATACFLFAIGQNFLFFAALMALSGIAIGIFKTGALALIGDLAPRPGSTRRS